MPAQIDKEKVRKHIARMLDRIRAEEDPHLLNEYRALFRKEISLFRRSWVSAYLLMLFDQGALGQADAGRTRKAAEARARNGGGRSAAIKDIEGSETPGEARRGPPLPEGESKRLFFSVGRNRRVFPREILGLINAKTAIPREDIGNIRILDNYSFVQVRDTVAEQIITALNGCSFRGRTLAVNYAKSRQDDGGLSTENTETDETETAAGSLPDTDEPGAAESEQTQDHPDKEDI